MIFLTPSLVELEVRYYSDAPFQCLFIMDFQVVTGKQLIFGFNAKGKPAFYNRPRSSIQFIVWMLEHAMNLKGLGVE